MSLDDHSRIEIEEALSHVEEAPFLLGLYDAAARVRQAPDALIGWWTRANGGVKQIIGLGAFYLALITFAIWKQRRGG